MHASLFALAWFGLPLTKPLFLPRNEDTLGIIKLPVLAAERARNASKRGDEVVTVPLRDEGIDFTVTGMSHHVSSIARSIALTYTTVGIGDPPQYVELSLDTGSSDIWVNPLCAGSRDAETCESYSRFNCTRSPTCTETEQAMGLRYGTGFALGRYYTDDIHIGEVTVSNQHFGIAENSGFMTRGILGMGYEEHSWGILDEMVTQEIIQSPAFSMYLGSTGINEGKLRISISHPILPADVSGSIIFGGLDTKKFSGSLEKMPMLRSSDTFDGVVRYWVSLDSVGMTEAGGDSQLLTDKHLDVDVVLDSGATFSYLPLSIADNIAGAFSGARWHIVHTGISKCKYYVVNCDYMSSDATIDFTFGDTVIHVALSDFIHSMGKDRCELGTAGVISSRIPFILGGMWSRPWQCNP